MAKDTGSPKNQSKHRVPIQAARLFVCSKYKQVYGNIEESIRHTNSERKTHQIAQIRHFEFQKRHCTTKEVDLRIFRALT